MTSRPDNTRPHADGQLQNGGRRLSAAGLSPTNERHRNDFEIDDVLPACQEIDGQCDDGISRSGRERQLLWVSTAALIEVNYSATRLLWNGTGTPWPHPNAAQSKRVQRLGRRRPEAVVSSPLRLPAGWRWAADLSPRSQTSRVPPTPRLAVRSARDEAIQAAVTPETTSPDLRGFPTLWAVAWRARAAAWILDHCAPIHVAINR